LQVVVDHLKVPEVGEGGVFWERTTLAREEFRDKLPKFLAVDQEVTGDSAFSMFNLSLREEWLNNKRFCNRLSDDDDDDIDEY
jgi:hypothetical protein